MVIATSNAQQGARSVHRDNHFASVCRSKASRAVQNVTATHAACVESSIAEGVQHVSYGEYEALNNIQINNVTTVDPYMCTLLINGVSVTMEIDTGTAATIISSRQYELIKQAARRYHNHVLRSFQRWVGEIEGR